MRSLLLSLMLAGVAYPATFVVCNSMPDTISSGSACTHTTSQAAISASANGDTIIFKANETHAKFNIPNGRRSLLLKSSEIDKWPRGYRVTPYNPFTGTGNNPYLARIESTNQDTPVTIGDDRYIVNLTAGNATGNFGQLRSVSVNQKVTIETGFLTPYYCRAANDAAYTINMCQGPGTDPVNNNYDKYTVRVDTFNRPYMADGYVLRVIGGSNAILGSTATWQEMTGLTAGQFVYVRDYAVITVASTTYITFNVAATLGGAAIVPAASYLPTAGVLFEITAYPLIRGDQLYIKTLGGVAPYNVTFSQTIQGADWTWPQISIGYSGSFDVPGVRIVTADPPEDITLDGFEVLTNAAHSEPFHMVYVYSGATAAESPKRLAFKRMYVHGKDDQEHLPLTLIRTAADYTTVTDSYLAYAYSRSNDTQCISISGPGNAYIENNFMKCAGMSMMSGGGFSYPEEPRDNIVLVNNHGTKDRKWQGNLIFSVVTSQQLRLSNAGGTSCYTNRNATDAADRCGYFTGDHQTWQWHFLPTPANELLVSYSGSGNGAGILYGDTSGVVHLIHNIASGLTVDAAIDNVYTASTPALPDSSYNLLASFTLTSGSFSVVGGAYSKNIFESKYGRKIRIEGNVMENAYIHNRGGNQQGMCVNLTSAGDDSGSGPLNYNAVTQDTIVRNNICRHSGSGVLIIGRGYSTTRNENNLLTHAEMVVVENNLFYDIGMHFYTYGQDGMLFKVNDRSWGARVNHNTAVDIHQAYKGGGSGSSSDPIMQRLSYTNNVLIPYLHSEIVPASGMYLTPPFSSQSHPATGGEGCTTWVGCVNAWTIAGSGVGASTLSKNILMNSNLFTSNNTRPTHYPGAAVGSAASLIETYCLSWNGSSGDACRNDRATIFQSFTERTATTLNRPTNYAASNYRFVAAYANYPTTDGKTIGADIDEIEDLVGLDGADVVAGRPNFETRSAQRIVPSTTSAVISYMPLSSSACTIKVWSSPTYLSGSVHDANDSGATVSNGRRSVSITGLTSATKYYGKRTCDTSVSVFDFTTL